jgi:DNA-binding CsgD family transcriptional regulator
MATVVTNEHDEDNLAAFSHVYNIVALGRAAEIDAALAAIPTASRMRDPGALTLRAMKSILGGDVAGGIALLTRAHEHTEGATHEYLTDLLAPLLISTGNVEEAADVLGDQTGEAVPVLSPAFLALRSAIAARRGQDKASRTFSEDALRQAGLLDNPLVKARVLMRAAIAAFYREDFAEAQEHGLLAARALESLGSPRNAAQAYSILLVVAHDWSGDADVARYFAERLTMNAQLAGDLSIQGYGLVAQLGMAADAGEKSRFHSIRTRLLANPLSEQYCERFAYVMATVLANGWDGNFEAARAGLATLRGRTGTSAPDRALCDALTGLIALASWDLETARRFARRALGQTGDLGAHEPLYDARQRRIARFVASAVCIIAGDAIRGRRALSRRFDPEQNLGGAIGAQGVDESRVPPLMLGYAKIINAVCQAAEQARPQHGLTRAEMEILKALPAGVTLGRIAADFGKSRKTVERQVESIYGKLRVTNRAQAIARARDLGICT